MSSNERGIRCVPSVYYIVVVELAIHEKISIFLVLASGPPPAAHARPSGLKRHSRGEDAFKEGRCIQGGNEAFKRN